MMTGSATSERQRLQQAISALEAQREILGDDVVDASVSALERQLAGLQEQARDRQRKQVTVLFADVSGFTAMSEMLDPEEVSNIMNTLWTRLDAVITSYGGFIDKHIGDAVMALWGVQTVQETDPEMAIRAALAMQQALVFFRAEVRHGLDMRIGINTGPVLLGAVGSSAEFTAIGDTVNTADRLEKVAPVGQILIAHNTYQHVRGVFDVTPLEPVNVKGKEAPQQVYIVKQAKARSFRTRRRGVEGVETRMIGRGQEKTQLQESLKTVIEASQRQVITIVGEAGLGKSRLLYEFESWVDLQDWDTLLLRGRARRENQHIPFGLFRDMFAFRFNIQEDDSAAIVRQKLAQGFRDVMEPAREEMPSDDDIEMRAHLVGHLLSYNLGHSPHLAPLLVEPKQIRDRAFTYLQTYFQDAATSDPVLVLIEDLQWADDSSLDMLARGAQLLADLPLLVVATARPTFYERRPDWFAGDHFQIQLGLQPLSRRENRRLVYEILKLAEDVPDDLRDLIVDNSEGNPFYVEELIKMLIDEGAIVKGEDNWRITVTDLEDLHVPATLAGILGARLDSLTPAEKSIAQKASIVGRVFWDDAVAGLNNSDEHPLEPSALHGVLQSLRDRELIYKREPSTFSQATEFTFKHTILREVAYESVLLSKRRRYHGLAADWLRAQSGERSSEMVGLRADHLIKAGRDKEAVVDLLLAGKHAAARYANDEAETFFTRAFALAPDEDIPTRYDILRQREKVYHQHGDREKQAADLDTLVRLAEKLGPVKMANVSLRKASFAEATSDYEAMMDAARQSIEYVSDDGPPAILARSYLEWGIALERTGQYEPAHDHLERALALAREAGDRSLAALSLRGLGIIARARRRFTDAFSYYSLALTQFVELGDRNAQASTLVWLGVLSTNLGDIAGARSYYEEALELTRKTGFRYQESFALSNLGSNANYRGDYGRAISFIEQALAIAREIENHIVECLCLNNLGTVTLNQGDYAASLPHYQDSLAIALDTGHRSMEASARTGVSHALLLLGDHNGAIEALENATAVRRELDAVDLYESLAILAYARLLGGSGEEARQTLLEVLLYLDDGGKFYVTEYGLRNYLYVIEVLEQIGDPRAADIVKLAHLEFTTEAERIPDTPTRHAFSQDIPFHREIVARWKQQQEAFRQPPDDRQAPG